MSEKAVTLNYLVNYWHPHLRRNTDMSEWSDWHWLLSSTLTTDYWYVSVDWLTLTTVIHTYYGLLICQWGLTDIDYCHPHLLRTTDMSVHVNWLTLITVLTSTTTGALADCIYMLLMYICFTQLIYIISVNDQYINNINYAFVK